MQERMIIRDQRDMFTSYQRDLLMSSAACGTLLKQGPADIWPLLVKCQGVVHLKMSQLFPRKIGSWMLFKSINILFGMPMCSIFVRLVLSGAVCVWRVCLLCVFCF